MHRCVASRLLKAFHLLCSFFFLSGNVGSETVADMLKRTAPSVYIVAGDSDSKTDYPEYEVVQIGEFKIGLIHGHQALGNFDLLSSWQRKLDCDVLVFGSTHRNTAEKVRGKFYINPGSATGAYRPRNNSTEQEQQAPVVPSFMLMSIRDRTAILYVYELRDGKVNVSKSELDIENY